MKIKTNNILLPALCLAILISCFFYLLLTTAGDGTPSFTEPDTRIFLQYAQNMADGHPYVFTRGETPSTGSTSHLYALLLALPALLGITGNGLVVVSFLLNAVFYLAALWLAWLIAKALSPRAAPIALALVLLSGHTVSAMFGMTDIGLFTVLALATFAALLYEKPKLSILLALLCSISRPEGFVFAIAFLMCGIGGFIANRKTSKVPGSEKQSRSFLVFGITGAIVFMLLLGVNKLLTGHFQFMSVANKGYFQVFPFWGAIESILFDTLRIVKGVFFGLPDSNRQFYIFPMLGGVLGLAGILLNDRSDKKTQLCECWLALSVSAALVIVASGQFQGISNDRYLGWIFVVWIIYVSIGVIELSERLRSTRFLIICVTILIAFQIASLGYIAADNYNKAVFVHREHVFGQQVAEAIPENETLGCGTGGSLNWVLPNHKVYNLYGILSPDFFEKGTQQQLLYIVDLLKNNPELRFDHWYNYMNFTATHQWAVPFVGELEMMDADAALLGPYSHAIYKAKWETLDGGDIPLLKDDRLKSTTLIGKLDVGYIPHEREFSYKIKPRLKNTVTPVVAHTAKLGDSDYSEAGRIVLGSERFIIKEVDTSKPLYIILRTARSAKGIINFSDSTMPINHLEMANELDLILTVNKWEVPRQPVKIGSNGFSEVLFEIPAHVLKGKKQRIKLDGDHISFAYWFYQ